MDAIYIRPDKSGIHHTIKKQQKAEAARYKQPEQNMRSEYRQSIQIGRNPNGILALPCVTCVMKSLGNRYAYQVDTESSHTWAYEGDWICEDYDEQWHVVSDGRMNDTARVQQ